ncbi:MAG TPA: thioredoxin family protein, partial [Lacipirellulaceae bacterium]|nr:thioredoxin family protein [Lacipirellulaceae bacterium]
MLMNDAPRAIIAAIALLVLNASQSLAAEQKTPHWLRGSGANLEICLKGEVFQFDGRPAGEIQISGTMNSLASTRKLEPKIDGNRFEVWMPVNQERWYSMWLKAASTNTEGVAYKQLNAYELRQAAIDGLRLTLQSPSRHVLVKVIEGGRPVADANVKAELGFGAELRSRTGADGTCRIDLLPEQKLDKLTAWTDDHRVGGFSFNRTPTRDPDAGEHVIELSKCHDQKLRFIAEDGAPVAGIDFVIQMATASPDYNFIGTNEHSRLTTDAAGEVVYHWFPDWEKHHFYPDLDTTEWYLVGEPETSKDAVVFKLKRSAKRKLVEGRLISTGDSDGGFYVTLRSFQGEREDYSDITTAFTDADGKFTVDVLPDATYCAYALDSNWVGEMIDLIPYDSKLDQVAVLDLAVLEGQEVEVLVTTGPKRKPYPNLSINFRREHRYSWIEDGEVRHGLGGPQWWATTNDAGRATTRTLPGKLTATVYTPLWRTEETVEVASGETAKIQLHRPVEAKRRVTGQLSLAEGLASDLKGAEIKFGAIDGHYNDEQTLSANDGGSFSFETMANVIGIFACTRDGRAAGAVRVWDLDSPIELRLQPTLEYRGQLLGEGDEPLAGHSVRAILWVEGGQNFNAAFSTSFEAKRIETETDAQGNYTLSGIPSEMKVAIYASAIDDPSRSSHLGEVFLDPNESRPRTISRLKRSSATTVKVSLAQRYESTLRDCALGGYRLMLVLAGDAKGTSAFVKKHFVDYDRNNDVYDFMQLVVDRRQRGFDSADAAFLKERNWELPSDRRVTAYAMDASGKQLGVLDIDISDASAAAKAAEFIRQHRPQQADAEAKWNEAFAEASRSNRRVWARISQRYCGWCFHFSRWLDDQKPLLEKDYVMLKIDDLRDLNGKEVAERLTRGQRYGVPFHAIFDPSGELVIDSAGRLGNIGHPSDLEGRKHLRKMLL